MKTVIGADATRLVGLQIDTLSKARSGQLSLDHWERFINLAPEAREERFGDGKKPKAVTMASVGKFSLLGQFTFTVPAKHQPVGYLEAFLEKHGRSLAYFNNAFTDQNYPQPTHELIPGKTYLVKCFGIMSRVTSQECLDQVKANQGYLVGTQGLAMAYQEKKEEFPVGKSSVSFDELERLWYADGHHRVPGVHRYSDSDFGFDLGRFEGDWYDDRCLLCFCDVE